MELDKLESIVKLLKGTEITEFELEEEGSVLKINRGSSTVVTATAVAAAPVSIPVATAAPEAAPVDDTAGLTKVESPIVGTFYSRPAPDAESFVKVGDTVKKGDKLCIVEAMKLMNEIDASVSGTIEKILLTDGQVVEYGEVLFLIKE